MPGIDLDFGGDVPLILDEFVGIDLAVVVGVELGEEAVGIRPHLVGREHAVAVAVGLVNQFANVSSLAVWARNGSPIGLMNGAQAWPDDDGTAGAGARPRREDRENRGDEEHDAGGLQLEHFDLVRLRERLMKRSGAGTNLRRSMGSPICARGSRRTGLSPTWSDPEGSSHNDFVPGRRLPPLALREPHAPKPANR